jgi:hypothetical protein
MQIGAFPSINIYIYIHIHIHIHVHVHVYIYNMVLYRRVFKWKCRPDVPPQQLGSVGKIQGCGMLSKRTGSIVASKPLKIQSC